MYWDIRHTVLLIIGLMALAVGLAPGCRAQTSVTIAKCGDMVPVTFTKSGRNASLWRVATCPGDWVAAPTGPWYRCECPAAKEN